MKQSLNLMAHRSGPSVWARMELVRTADALVAFTVGALAFAVSARGRSRVPTAATGLMCVGSAYLFGRAVNRASKSLSWPPAISSRSRLDAVDRTVDDSFPASDPPSSMQATAVPAERH